MKTIKSSNGQDIILDDEDFERLKNFHWNITCDGYVRNSKYLRKQNGKDKYKHTLMHKLILLVPDGFFIDHKNGNKLDNRKGNLRICTNSQNQMNRRKGSGFSSRYKGVHWHKKHSKWIVQIRVNGKPTHVGCFDSEKHAALAYNKSAIKHYGEFALLNKIS